MSSALGTVTKRKGSTLDYTVNWAAWLPTGDTLLTSTFTVTSGITIASQSNTTSTGTVWLSGGSAGQTYTVTHTITTNDGRADARTFDVFVQ